MKIFPSRIKFLSLKNDIINHIRAISSYRKKFDYGINIMKLDIYHCEYWHEFKKKLKKIWNGKKCGNQVPFIYFINGKLYKKYIKHILCIFNCIRIAIIKNKQTQRIRLFNIYTKKIFPTELLYQIKSFGL